MFESLSVEIKFLSATIKAKCLLTFLVYPLPLFLQILPKIRLNLWFSQDSPYYFLVQAANGDMKLHPSVRDSVEVTGLTHSVESSMPKVVPVRLVAKPTVPEQQSVPTPCLLHYQTNPMHYLKEHKGGYFTLALSRTHRSLQSVIVSAATFKALFLNRSAPVHAKYKEPKEIGLAKPTSLANGTVPKLVAQNADDAAFPYHHDLVCSQSNLPWLVSHHSQTC
ncbi:unnamed protein product [Hymenolepis diminuta]|uniref:Nucleoporin_N domain-containing protein n=1 Tax=Hymenolepis diminuta TaxID=6216 RepID=A0A0R3SDT2_HYMDI|nr:unnamed protein product [Hymenolepis diminuta]